MAIALRVAVPRKVLRARKNAVRLQLGSWPPRGVQRVRAQAYQPVADHGIVVVRVHVGHAQSRDSRPRPAAPPPALAPRGGEPDVIDVAEHAHGWQLDHGWSEPCDVTALLIDRDDRRHVLGPGVHNGGAEFGRLFERGDVALEQRSRRRGVRGRSGRESLAARKCR